MEKENDAETLKRKHEVEDDDFDAPKVREKKLPGFFFNIKYYIITLFLICNQYPLDVATMYCTLYNVHG